MKLNLNADLGESFGPWPMGNDGALLEVVDSANLACGFHAGDPTVMSQTVERARTHDVSIGAHPGFPDLQGFGRRAMSLSDTELEAVVQYQVGALEAIAESRGMPLTHVKPHGAMNNLACENRPMADVISKAIAGIRPSLILLAPALSELATAGDAAGLPVALEIFADRAYTDRGTLLPRSEPGAVITGHADCIDHVKRLIEAEGIVSQSGKRLPTAFHSICVHGDGGDAVATARALRVALIDAGHQLLPLPELMA